MNKSDLEDILLSLRKDLKLNNDRKSAAFTGWAFQRPDSSIRYVIKNMIRLLLYILCLENRRRLNLLSQSLIMTKSNYCWMNIKFMHRKYFGLIKPAKLTNLFVSGRFSNRCSYREDVGISIRVLWVSLVTVTVTGSDLKSSSVIEIKVDILLALQMFCIRSTDVVMNLISSKWKCFRDASRKRFS